MLRILVADNHEDGMFKCRGELLEALVKDNEVFVSVPSGKYTKLLKRMGCIHKELKISRRGMNPIKELQLIKSYNLILKEIRPDVVLTYSIKPNVYLGFLCGIKKIPYIANVTGLGSAIRGGGLTKQLTIRLYRLGLRKAEKVFCQNKDNKEILIKNKVINGECEIIPGSGVNLAVHKFEKYPPDDGQIRFITIGRIMKEKGTDELLTAAKMIKKKKPFVSFKMIGFFDGEYEEKISRAEKEGYIEYCGHQDDVHAFIKDSHAVIHPSYHEGMANALLEAAAAGRPVIATDVPGCKEAYVDNITGIACESKNAKSLEEAILKFIDLPYDKKIAMGIAARKKMEEEFSRDIVVNKYLLAISKIKEQNKNESV